MFLCLRPLLLRGIGQRHLLCGSAYTYVTTLPIQVAQNTRGSIISGSLSTNGMFARGFTARDLRVSATCRGHCASWGTNEVTPLPEMTLPMVRGNYRGRRGYVQEEEVRY